MPPDYSERVPRPDRICARRVINIMLMELLQVCAVIALYRQCRALEARCVEIEARMQQTVTVNFFKAWARQTTALGVRWAPEKIGAGGGNDPD